ncbi:uncharacterized protein SAZU_4338 [Streptomyces azureus]|uniref:Uncharacterized protein n=1 Tax=Streptomyces azureus TaxID=146537 RepID=A0A0K8PPV7_STRAJ|nr:uncharacterized protein SAZU_4338 [Streptomyces azureus]
MLRRYEHVKGCVVENTIVTDRRGLVDLWRQVSAGMPKGRNALRRPGPLVSRSEPPGAQVP